MHKPAIFLDRDGVLNHLVVDPTCDAPREPRSADELVLFQRAAGFVSELNARGYLVIVVTHQPARARGQLSPAALARINARLRDGVAAGGGRIDGVHCCPHDPDADPAIGGELAISCSCRRPAPGLILRAAQQHRVDLSRSFALCRVLDEVKAGRSAAVETVLLTDYRLQDIEVTPELRPHHVARDLASVLALVDAARMAEGAR